MLTLILAPVMLLTIAGVLYWITTATQPFRVRRLKQIAQENDYEYQRWQRLPEPLTRENFLSLALAEARFVANWIEHRTVFDEHTTFPNKTPLNTADQNIVAFDLSLVSADGLQSQTMIAIECGLLADLSFTLSQRKWLRTDLFEQLKQSKPALIPLSEQDLPTPLVGWCIEASRPHALRKYLTTDVCNWLLAHKHLHIEYAAGMLMICSPNMMIDPDLLPDAFVEVHILSELLDPENSKLQK
ncbi:MAG: hypothetical protein P1U57_03160 [Oleibacter sp.]|nr:hypothetical protein [Thalassolituus sp.]